MPITLIRWASGYAGVGRKKRLQFSQIIVRISTETSGSNSGRKTHTNTNRVWDSRQVNGASSLLCSRTTGASTATSRRLISLCAMHRREKEWLDAARCERNAMCVCRHLQREAQKIPCDSAYPTIGHQAGSVIIF
jgi:hypothetical protein